MFAHAIHPNARLLLGLAGSALSKALAILTMAFRQIPALIATNHNNITLFVLYNTSSGLHPYHLNGKSLKGSHRLRPQNHDAVVILKKSDYLRSGNILNTRRLKGIIPLRCMRSKEQFAGGKPNSDATIILKGELWRLRVLKMYISHDFVRFQRKNKKMMLNLE